ncbi:MAG: efflux RND transporter periplasmic adaptor subunit [Ignavibacteriales bacterium]|nr:efflux RND transporter periplasmic adaptor subunit [Ignavibacteriales bacterium]
MKTLKSFFTSTINHQPLYIAILLIIILIGCSAKNKNENPQTSVKEYWTCTMHPQVHMDRPGACPICGMDLIKKVVDEKVEPANDKDMADMVTLSGKKQILANVSTVVVKKENLQNQVTAYSYLDFVENNRKTISARFNGRIEKLFVDKTGDYIKKGQALFEIYSPDLVQAQNEYLIALNNSSNSTSLLSASKKKLEIFGLTSEQILTLEKTREINLTLTYFSPVSGTVIEKKVQEGVYVNEGTAIYDVAELSTLWNIAEVYENNLASVKVGSPVKLHLRAYPGEEFNGRVTFIYPVINSQTRTVKVRSEFSSLGGKLKPQMYGETVFNSAGGQGLLVPADAVIIAGQRAVVWTKTGDGMFEARSVQIGNRFGDKYQILSGLNEGDEIAATGGFLIDSESQLKTGIPNGDKTNGSKKSTPGTMPGMKM